MRNQMPNRSAQRNQHEPPSWINGDAVYFITINCRTRGIAQLTNDETAKAVMNSVSHYHNAKRWWPMLLLLMPDHLHALISFRWDKGHGMNKVIEDWKRYHARSNGIQWQRGYSDHRIRSENDMNATWSYIMENPVKAGLVDSSEQWPHVWRPEM